MIEGDVYYRIEFMAMMRVENLSFNSIFYLLSFTSIYFILLF